MRWGVVVGSILMVVLLGAGMAGCAISPLEPGTKDCVGMEAAVCQSLLMKELVDNPRLAPKAYRIRCTVALCTAVEGSAEILIVWSDGSVATTTKSWTDGTK